MDKLKNYVKTSNNWGRSKTGCWTGRGHKYERLRIYNNDYKRLRRKPQTDKVALV